MTFTRAAQATALLTVAMPGGKLDRRRVAKALTSAAAGIFTVATTTLAVAPIALADGMFDICPSGHTGVMSGTPTSCAFADNVHDAWNSQQSNPVYAYSPVTGQTYTMNCVPGEATVGRIQVDGWICYGGKNAQVVLW